MGKSLMGDNCQISYLLSERIYLLSCWYTKKELALRYAVLYSGLVLATAFSGPLAAGIFAGLEGAMGLPGWEWLFIVEGAISFPVVADYRLHI